MLCRPAIVRTILGVLLLATAGLKLFGLGTAGVASSGWFAQPWVQLLAAEWELVLGAWLLSGVAVRASWWFALVTFLAFATISGYMGWIGVASCNCLGAIKTNPWWTFAVDVVAVGALLSIYRRSELSDVPQSQYFGSVVIGKSVFFFALGLCVTAVSGVVIYGSLDRAVAKLRNERVSLRPRVVNIGVVQAGNSVPFKMELTNWTDQQITFVGGTSDCTCVTIADLPITLEARESKQVTIYFEAPSTVGQFTRTATFWIHDQSMRQIVFPITGRIQQQP